MSHLCKMFVSRCSNSMALTVFNDAAGKQKLLGNLSAVQTGLTSVMIEPDCSQWCPATGPQGMGMNRIT